MQKHILYVNHHISPMFDHHIQALRLLNFKVSIFNYYQPTFLVRTLGVLHNNKIINAKKPIVKMTNEALMQVVKQLRPDYLLVVKGMDFYPQLIKQISESGVCTINWFPDFWEFMPWYKKNVWAYDYFFDADELVVQALQKKYKQVFYLPYATNPDPVIWKVPKRHEIVFCGQWTARRERIFLPLVPLGLKIWGYRDWLKSPLASCYQGYLPDMRSVFDIFRQAKIVVNVVTGEDSVPVKTVNLRVFEVTGIGSFLLSWYKPPVNNFFKNGKEIVNFRTKSELVQKASYYLKHERERESIATAGWKRTATEHTYIHRFRNMFARIDRSTFRRL